MYSCMFVCMYMATYVHMCVCMYVCINVYMYIYIYMCVCVCMYVYKYTYIHTIHIMHVCIHIYIYNTHSPNGRCRTKNICDKHKNLCIFASIVICTNASKNMYFSYIHAHVFLWNNGLYQGVFIVNLRKSAHTHHTILSYT